MMTGLGRAKELGFPAGTLLTWYAPFFVGELTNAAYNPYLVATYRSCTQDQTGAWFTTWAARKAAYLSSVQTLATWNDSPTAIPDYAELATSAVSYMANESGGAAAWSFMKTNALSSGIVGFVPKYAIMPRAVASGASLTCDLNQDGQVNILDVQLATIQVLGIVPCTSADLTQSGSCDAVDVQRVIIAALTGVCVIGP
jgi:hypothetical protein